MIDREFRANNITIPFPQRDLHIKGNELLSLLAHANKIEAVKENE